MQEQKLFESLESNSKEQTLDSDLEDVVSCLDEEDANTLDLKELKEKKEIEKVQKECWC